MVAAQNALLTFMVGGSEQHFEPAKILLDNMGKNVVHCGAVGTGQVRGVHYVSLMSFCGSHGRRTLCTVKLLKSMILSKVELCRTNWAKVFFTAL